MSTDDAIRTIVVGVDASEGAAAALRWAIAEARSTGAEVIAVHAHELHYSSLRANYPLEAWATAERQSFELVWCAPPTPAGVPCRKVFRIGHAGPVLADAVREFDVDLAVTGRRGLNTWPSWSSGASASTLVHRAGCPVVVVPMGAPATKPLAAATARASR